MNMRLPAARAIGEAERMAEPGPGTYPSPRSCFDPPKARTARQYAVSSPLPDARPPLVTPNCHDTRNTWLYPPPGKYRNVNESTDIFTEKSLKRGQQWFNRSFTSQRPQPTAWNLVPHRNMYYSSQIPGPGHYETPSQWKTYMNGRCINGSMGTTPRSNAYRQKHSDPRVHYLGSPERSETPSPGLYSPLSTEDKRFFAAGRSTKRMAAGHLPSRHDRAMLTNSSAGGLRTLSPPPSPYSRRSGSSPASP